MIQELLKFDTQLFLFINHLPHNFFVHSFFASLSGIGRWGLVWLILAGFLFFWEKWRNPHKLVSLILAVAASWIAVELFLKNLIQRVRPELAVPGVLAVTEKYFTYSFPSSHATIAFAASFIMGRHHKRLKWFYYLLAFLIASSRIYLGKHYPSDVLAGAIFGIMIGHLSLFITQKFVGKVK